MKKNSKDCCTNAESDVFEKPNEVSVVKWRVTGRQQGGGGVKQMIYNDTEFVQ